MSTEWGIRRRELLACALGGSLVLGHGCLDGRLGSARPGVPALFAADVAAHMVYGLDADAFICSQTRIQRPVQIRCARTVRGAVSVLSAGESLTDGPYEAVELGATGEILAREPCAAPSAWPRRISAFEWSRDGGLIAAMAPARHPHKRWLLRARKGAQVEGSNRLERWVRHSQGARWRRAFLFELPFTARDVVEHAGAAWVAGDRVCEVRMIRNDGSTALRRRIPDADGVEAIIPASRASGGGIWLAACGAIVRLDHLGRRMPGQGGFAHVVSLRSSPRPDAL